MPSANTSRNGRAPAAIYAFRRLPACRRDARRRPPRSTAAPTPRVTNEKKMRGTSVPKTPSKTMPSRTPMMTVLVMSRFLVEERRIRGPWGPGFLTTTLHSSAPRPVGRPVWGSVSPRLSVTRRTEESAAAPACAFELQRLVERHLDLRADGEPNNPSSAARTTLCSIL